MVGVQSSQFILERLESRSLLFRHVPDALKGVVF